MNKIFVSIPNSKILHLDLYLYAILYFSAQIVRDASNELFSAQKIFMDSQCNVGLSRICGMFEATYKKWHNPIHSTMYL